MGHENRQIRPLGGRFLERPRIHEGIPTRRDSSRGTFPTGVPPHAHNEMPGWVYDEVTLITGALLESIGLLAPVIAPESGFVIECEAV